MTFKHIIQYGEKNTHFQSCSLIPSYTYTQHMTSMFKKYRLYTLHYRTTQIYYHKTMCVFRVDTVIDSSSENYVMVILCKLYRKQ